MNDQVSVHGCFDLQYIEITFNSYVDKMLYIIFIAQLVECP